MPNLLRSSAARAVALAAVGAVLLSACSSSFQSPAAEVGHERIGQAELEAQVAIQRGLSNQQDVAPESDAGKTIVRQVLSNLIQYHVIQGYARDHGIAVSGADVEQGFQQTLTQVGGTQQLNVVLKQRKLTASDLREAISRGLLLTRVEQSVATDVAHLGAGAAQQQMDQAFSRWLRSRLSSLGVRVNPRFGRFDLTSGQIRPITSTAT